MINRYEKLGDVVLDTKTGLEWQTEATGPITWDEAMEYAESLGKDWSLPSRFELESLLNLERANPASDFPGMPAQAFWSSSVYADNSSFAWVVGFGYGCVYYTSYFKSYNLRVRCVRRGTSRFGSLAEAEARVAELEAELREAERRWDRYAAEATEAKGKVEQLRGERED